MDTKWTDKFSVAAISSIVLTQIYYNYRGSSAGLVGEGKNSLIGTPLLLHECAYTMITSLFHTTNLEDEYLRFSSSHIMSYYEPILYIL